MTIKNRVENLRKLMKENKIDAYIIPSFDANQSEYVAEHWKSREWISGFSGSAGTVVITLDDAGLWADGRYFIQAEKELENSGIRLFKMLPGVPTYPEWLADTLCEGNTIGFDGYVFSVDQVRQLETAVKGKEISLKIDKDLIGELWEDRPEIPNGEIFIHDLKYAGKSRVEKLNEVREEMQKQGASHYLLTSLDDIAWLLNVRGSDVPNNPVVTSNVVVTEEASYLFIDGNKVPDLVKSELEADGIHVKEAHGLEGFLANISSENKVLFNPSKVNYRLYNAVGTSKVEQSPDVTTNLKAIKNEIEMENFRHCEVKDGVAMVKFIKWLKENVDKEEITEISAEEKLIAFRSEQEGFAGPSFDAIFGYKDHAAMMHYKAKPETQYTLERSGMFLMDSGGQYFDGTTDTTRTVVLGELTEREKRDFTLVLQGFIALSAAKFLHGTTGCNLDILARQPIWRQGIDYKCGTGHGVGFFLNVHEGPQGFNGKNNVVLEKGMNLTNEPGIYLEGQYGIRTENMMFVVEDEKTEFGQFMKFEAITYCPIDINGVNVDMLTAYEKNWLNEYHRDVYGKLSPYLNEEEKAWLQEETREV